MLAGMFCSGREFSLDECSSALFPPHCAANPRIPVLARVAHRTSRCA